MTAPQLAAALDWQERAACRGADGEAFFPSPADHERTEQARQICRRCPVLRACLAYALEWDVDGIWAATTKQERDALRKKHRLDVRAVVTEDRDAVAERRAHIAELSAQGATPPRSHYVSALPNTSSTPT